jgi:putative phosphoesterase
MKIGIIADIHSNIFGLRAVLKKLEKMDVILCAGDIVGYYTFINEVFGEIKNRNIKCVLGNHDAYLLEMIPFPTNPIVKPPIIYTKEQILKENLDFLKKTGSASCELEIDNIKIKLYHGSPWDNFEEYIYPDYQNFEKFDEVAADLIILGHTHCPMIKKTGDKIILNPGSCGQPRDYDFRASYAIFDTKTREVIIQKIEYDFEKVCQAARKEKFDERLIKILEGKK